MTTLFPWLETTWQHLVSYKNAEAIPHALMLSGIEGIGKRQLAEHFAKYALCQGSTGAPCGECRACQLYDAGTHPDFFLLTPEEDSLIIKIDQVRNLVQSLGQTSNLSGYQVVIISVAEALHRSAANALLKTLEEPRGKVVFLLVSHQPSAVPATIRSRCQHVRISLPTRSVARNWLASTIEEKHLAEFYLSLTDGIPLKALNYSQNAQFPSQDALLSELENLQKGNVDPVQVAAKYIEQPKANLHFFAMLLIDIIRVKLGASDQVSQNKIKQLQPFASQLKIYKLFQFLEQITDALRLLQHSNLNVQLIMEKLFITWRYDYVS